MEYAGRCARTRRVPAKDAYTHAYLEGLFVIMLAIQNVAR